jgi:hypothetical protein
MGDAETGLVHRLGIKSTQQGKSCQEP